MFEPAREWVAAHPTRRNLLKLLSSAVSLVIDLPGQAEPTAVTNEIRIGAEFFLNPSETVAGVRRHFRLMRDSGLTLVRIFVIWNDIERQQGVWDFKRYDWLYDAAAGNGIKIVTTLCSEDPVGWAKDGPFYHNRTDLNDPAVRKRASEYIERVVNRYKAHPAQGVWLLMNEPTKYDTDAATFRAFGEWLRQRYGSLEKLNARWFRQFRDFSEINITPDMLKGGNYGWLDYPPIVDWREFNIDNLVNQLLWIKGQVLLHDKSHPTHINVTSPLGGAVGQDVWKEQRVVDILGASIHPAWSFPPSAAQDQYGELFAYHLDLVGGASGNKPWWVTELQGGPTIFSGGFPLNPTPADLTRWLWDTFGAGGHGVIFWLWNPREAGQEGGEWSLVSMEGKPSARIATIKQVAEDLKKMPSLAQAIPQMPQAAILYSRETAIINDLEGSRFQHRRDEWEQSIQGCYSALHRAHMPVRFVDIDQLKRGEVKQFEVLYAPYCYALDNECVAAVKSYVRSGGTLWADGLTAWKDAAGRVRQSIPGDLADVFGVEAFDIYPVKVDEPYSITSQDELAGELWRLPLELRSAEAFLSDKGGKPFATRNRCGKGRVIYFESALTLAYAKRSNPVVQQWIVQAAKELSGELPIQLTKGSPQIAFRGLVHSSGAVAILSNWGPSQEVTVAFQGEHRVVNPLTSERLTASFHDSLTSVQIFVPSDTVVVIEALRK
jgi:beta-galactosidase